MRMPEAEDVMAVALCAAVIALVASADSAIRTLAGLLAT